MKLTAIVALAWLTTACMPALAQPIGSPPALVAMVQAPGGYPRVPSESFLVAVEQLPKAEVQALSKTGRQDARIQLARLLWMDGNTAEPIEMLQGPAESGVPVAQYLLGTYLLFRNRDPASALKWMREAARQGHSIGRETLAGYHERGRNGVDVDLPRAFELYLAAGKQGLPHAQMNVGMMLCKGLGVTADKSIGREWFLHSQQGQAVPLKAKAAGCEDN
jgi:TPR repeat protein